MTSGILTLVSSVSKALFLSLMAMDGHYTLGKALSHRQTPKLVPSCVFANPWGHA